MRVLDLFAGAGGWDVATHRRGWNTDRVEIWNVANQTALAAGFNTIHEDVLTFSATPGIYRLVAGSPPCQTYSMAGKGTGRHSLDLILKAIAGARDLSGVDARTRLTLEPLRIILSGTAPGKDCAVSLTPADGFSGVITRHTVRPDLPPRSAAGRCEAWVSHR